MLHTATSVTVSDVTDHVTKKRHVLLLRVVRKDAVIHPFANNHFFLVQVNQNHRK